MGKMKFITQDDWGELLGSISDGSLTPIIGKEIYKYEEPGNTELLSFDTYLSKKLIEKFEITDHPAGTLTDTVDYLKNEKEKKVKAIINNLKDSVEEKKEFVFPLLENLLRITNLKFFVNTTVFYDILKRKIELVRKENDSDYKDFSPNSNFSFDQEIKNQNLSKTLVFNLFGSLNTDPAISEELMLEFTSEFGETLKNTPKLEVNFRNNNLLFLGCAYPEWMTRFVLRLLTDQAMYNWGTSRPPRNIYIVNDKSPFRDEQDKILKYYDVIAFEGSNKEFISELLRQWKMKYEKPKQIFLSYTRGDKNAVENLEKALVLAGNGKIKCWYDKEDLELAAKWRSEIIIEIDKADLFVPLISNNSLEHMGFVQKEWDAAYNTTVLKKKTSEYLIPIVIDDTDPYDKRVPKEFTELNIGKVPQGNPDDKFLNKIKSILNLE